MSEHEQQIPIADIANVSKKVAGEFANKIAHLKIAEFNLEELTGFKKTPKKPYYARMEASVDLIIPPEGQAGLLKIILLGPYDATGNEDDYKVKQIEFGKYQKDKKYVPRKVRKYDSEVAMILCSWREDDDQPIPYAGKIDMIGLKMSKNKKKKYELVDLTEDQFGFKPIGETFEERHSYASTTALKALFTTKQSTETENIEQRNDPHAIWNPSSDTWVSVGFLALKGDYEIINRELNLH